MKEKTIEIHEKKMFKFYLFLNIKFKKEKKEGKYFFKLCFTGCLLKTNDPHVWFYSIFSYFVS